MNYSSIIRIEFEGGEAVTCTASEFASDNADDMPAPMTEILMALEEDGKFFAGGGASVGYTIFPV